MCYLIELPRRKSISTINIPTQ